MPQYYLKAQNTNPAIINRNNTAPKLQIRIAWAFICFLKPDIIKPDNNGIHPNRAAPVVVRITPAKNDRLHIPDREKFGCTIRQAKNSITAEINRTAHTPAMADGRIFFKYEVICNDELVI